MLLLLLLLLFSAFIYDILIISYNSKLNKNNHHRYRAAAEWGIPIVKSRWITQSHEQEELLDWKLFKLEPFAGLCITLSGLHENDERTEMRKLIESNGGEHLGELIGDKTTHLITRVSSFLC